MARPRCTRALSSLGPGQAARGFGHGFPRTAAGPAVLPAPGFRATGRSRPFPDSAGRYISEMSLDLIRLTRRRESLSAENSLNRSRPESVHRVYRSLGAALIEKERRLSHKNVIRAGPGRSKACRHPYLPPGSPGTGRLVSRFPVAGTFCGDVTPSDSGSLVQGKRAGGFAGRRRRLRRPGGLGHRHSRQGQARDARRAGSSPSCARSGQVFAAVGVGTDCPTSQRLGLGGPGARPAAAQK